MPSADLAHFCKIVPDRPSIIKSGGSENESFYRLVSGDKCGTYGREQKSREKNSPRNIESILDSMKMFARVRSFIRSFVHSFVRSFVRSFVFCIQNLLKDSVFFRISVDYAHFYTFFSIF